MTAFRLEGCRSDSLLGYLKALGLFRVVSTRADRNARGAWDGETFVLDTRLPRDDVNAVILKDYIPTPVINPWNSGAGFDERGDSAEKTLQRVLQTTSQRWQPYRETLAFVIDHFVKNGRRRQLLAHVDKAAGKRAFVRELRTKCPEELLPWLDAAVILTADSLMFPYLLGSGGNDGRLDFSVNFAARALDVCGDQALTQTADLLDDALYGTARACLLAGVAIGQFSPRHVGGANATAGFDAESLVNPWDYVLMIEGSLLFAGAVARRTDRTPGRAVFPFAMRSIAGGYGTASELEERRGELWLPVWEGAASLPSVVDLLRKGRVDLPGGAQSVVRSAATASDAATAIVTMGVSLGLRKLERVAFMQRNGLAFAAASVGSVTVSQGYDHGVAILSRDTAGWVDRVRRADAGASVRQALNRFYENLFALPNVADDRIARARARQEILCALADIDRAVARTRGDEISPVPALDGGALDDLDDGSVEHRLAAAIASLGARHRDTNTRSDLRSAGGNAVQTLRGLLERRIRADEKNPRAGWLRSTCTVGVDDAAAFLSLGVAARTRFSRLLRAYALVRLSDVKAPRYVSHVGELPAAYAVLKLVFDHPKARDVRILRLLYGGDAGRALTLAVRRARSIRGLPSSARDVAQVVLADASWYAAALAIPIEQSGGEYLKLLNNAVVQRLRIGTPEDREKVHAYLASIA